MTRPSLLEVTNLEELRDLCVIDANGCWLFPKLDYNGYGRVRFEGQRWSAYVMALALHTGHRPRKGEFTLHKCDVRACCNPDDLYIGTPRDNVVDMYNRSPTIRRRIGESWSHRIVSEETKLKTASSNRGKKRTEEQRQNISRSLKGKKRQPLTEEHKQRISAAVKRSKESV